MSSLVWRASDGSAPAVTVCDEWRAPPQMRSRVYPAPAAPMGLMHGGGGGGAGYAPPRFLDGQPGSQLSLQVRYQPGYQPQPYRHQPPASLTVSTDLAYPVPPLVPGRSLSRRLQAQTLCYILYLLLGHHSFCILSLLSIKFTYSSYCGCA